MYSFSELPLEIIRKVVNFSYINIYFVLSSINKKINEIASVHLSDVKFYYLPMQNLQKHYCYITYAKEDVINFDSDFKATPPGTQELETLNLNMKLVTLREQRRNLINNAHQMDNTPTKDIDLSNPKLNHCQSEEAVETQATRFPSHFNTRVIKGKLIEIDKNYVLRLKPNLSDTKRETYFSFIKDNQDIMNEDLGMDDNLPAVDELGLDESIFLLEEFKETRYDEALAEKLKAMGDELKAMSNELTAKYEESALDHDLKNALDEELKGMRDEELKTHNDISKDFQRELQEDNEPVDFILKPTFSQKTLVKTIRETSPFFNPRLLNILPIQDFAVIFTETSIISEQQKHAVRDAIVLANQYYQKHYLNENLDQKINIEEVEFIGYN